MSRIAESELIVNKRGAIYHLDTRPEEIAGTIITVGDPDRVQQVSKFFDRIEQKNRHREFVLHTGWIGSKKVTCVSTGIGPDNVDIVVNELDALANIDFDKRMPREQLTALNIIRIGTAGSLQKDIPVDSFVVSSHGLGLDNLLNFYRTANNEEEKQLLQAFSTHTQLAGGPISPYITMASGHLLKHFTFNFHAGITVTCPGFYAPQGRVIRMGLAYPHLVDQLSSFRFGNYRVANFEMETSAIYGLGKTMGHHCLSLSLVVANRIVKAFSSNALDAMDKLIEHTLTTIADSNI